MDTFGFTSENEFDPDSDTVYVGSDFQISNDDEDQDYDIMFSNTSEGVVEGYSDLGRYMLQIFLNRMFDRCLKIIFTLVIIISDFTNIYLFVFVI